MDWTGWIYIIGFLITYVIAAGILSNTFKSGMASMERADTFMAGFCGLIVACAWPFLPLVGLFILMCYLMGKYSNTVIEYIGSKLAKGIKK